MKTILFISNRCGAAGVEAQLQRLVLKLSAEYQIGVLLARFGDNPEMYEALCQNAKVFVGTEFLSAKFRHFARQVDDVWVMSSYPLILYHLIQYFVPQAKLLLAVYHPDEYCWPQESPLIIRKLISSTLSNLPPSNIYFMNETCRDRHVEFYGQRFSTCPILPVFIGSVSVAVKRTLPAKIKIVSVGRITSFKTYNFTMLPVVAKLAKEYPVEYHVYGDGELMHQLKERVTEMGLNDEVILHGAVQYQERFKPYEDAYAFVGMGLSLIEAAASGVPALVAIEGGATPDCYGLFSELPGWSVGEMDANIQHSSIEKKLRRLLELNESEYLTISNRHKEKAKNFSDETLMNYAGEFIRSNESTTIEVHPLRASVALLQIVVATALERMGLVTWHSSRYGMRTTLTNRISN